MHEQKKKSVPRPLALIISALLISGVNGAAAQQFPASISLSTLNGANGFRVNGETAGNSSGYSVSAAGDINGDGIDDFSIGAPDFGAGSGSAYVVFGRNTPFPASFELSSLDGTNGFQLEGQAPADAFGVSVRAAGDINGDGVDDLIVGAFFTDAAASNAGSSYVVFGKRTPFSASLSVSGLDGSNGFRIDGNSEQDYSGVSVGAVGDINDDGFDDVAVGAWGTDPNSSVYVIFGRQSPFAATLSVSDIDGSNGFRIESPGSTAFFGIHVAKAGDVNGDNKDDLIITAPSEDQTGTNSGSAYVVFGKSTPFSAIFPITDLNGSNGFRIDGVAAADRLGLISVGAGDFNGDGLNDVMIGAYRADNTGNSSGSAYVVFGRSSFTPALALSSLNGSNGFRIDGAAAGDFLGIGMGSTDLNGDGLADVLIGALGSDAGASDAGSSYVVFGKTGPTNAVLAVTALNGNNGFRIDGIAAGDGSQATYDAGDVNGDMINDLIIGASDADPNGLSSGSSFVVFGRRSDAIFIDGFE
jgi:FG-GAP repeat